MFRKIVISLFFSVSLFASTISIAVASNVSYVMNVLLVEFHKSYPNIKVRVTLGSSGKLVAQIKNGAPYGLFMSANMSYPQALYDGNIAKTKPLVYAQGSLAYLSRKKQDFTKGIKLLKYKNIKRIAIANPKTAPYGKAAIQAIKNAGIYDEIKNKLIYSESISQTVSYAIMATDIGFIAKSSLYSSKMARFKKGINWVEVDAKLYTPIKQGVVMLKETNNIKFFYNFLSSKEAKKIFKRFGYLI